MSQPLEWCWIDRLGTQRALSAQELRDAIVLGAVPPDVPVWRQGMRAFMPAASVPEFAEACAKMRRTTAPRPGTVEAPGKVVTPSAESLQALKRTLVNRPPRASTPAPPPVAPPGTGPRPVPSPSRAPVKPMALPTQPLYGIGSHIPSQTPPPAASKPAAPKADSVVPAPVNQQAHRGTLLGMEPFDENAVELPRQDHTPLDVHGARRPPRTLSTAAQPIVVPASATKPAAAITLSPPFPQSPHDETKVPPAAPTPKFENEPADDVLEQEPAAPENPPPHPLTREQPPPAQPSDVPTAPPAPVNHQSALDFWKQTSTQAATRMGLPPNPWLLPAAAAGSLMLLLGLVTTVILASASTSDVAAPGRSSAAPPTASAGSQPQHTAQLPPPAQEPLVPAQACTFAGKRERLVIGASKDVPLELWAVEEQSRAALGVASKPTKAIGLVFDPATLRVERSFSRTTKDPVRRVVPVLVGNTISFEVDVDTPDALHDYRLTVPARPPRQIGSYKSAVTLSSGEGGVPEVLWKLNSESPLEAMRVSVIPSRGMAVVFRLDNALWLGWIGEDGTPAGEVARVPDTGVRVGAPSVGWNGREALVAFANQPSADAPWGVRLSRVGFGTAPQSSAEWTVPSGGPGGAVIAPSVLGLPDGRWIVVWTEGVAGARDVRVQTYDAQLTALGDAFTVSQPKSNAGQGIATIARDKGAVAYLSVVGTRYDVWGAAIECP